MILQIDLLRARGERINMFNTSIFRTLGKDYREVVAHVCLIVLKQYLERCMETPSTAMLIVMGQGSRAYLERELPRDAMPWLLRLGLELHKAGLLDLNKSDAPFLVAACLVEYFTLRSLTKTSLRYY
eukprot:jgi/Botrbrau1/11153/Bobra.182_2s0008.1